MTITTLGYGDILPLTQSARSLAFAEAIVGQFYIAVLVAGIVGAYISERADNSDQGYGGSECGFDHAENVYTRRFQSSC